jgi:hypothetical protein
LISWYALERPIAAHWVKLGIESARGSKLDNAAFLRMILDGQESLQRPLNTNCCAKLRVVIPHVVSCQR